MDKTVEDQSVDLMNLVAWLQINRKRVTTISAAIAAIGAAVGLYVWHRNHNETQANIALSNIKPPAYSPTGVLVPADPQPYMKVADDYTGTAAGSHAQLMAAQAYFDAGKFDQAKAQFEKFLAQYPDNPLASQASLGIAASLEAAGKTAEAATRYDDIIKRNQGSAILPEAKSALARLYVEQNKPEQAMRLYQELAQAGNNDTWSAEAGIQLEELLAKHPELKKQLTPPPAAVAPAAATGKPATAIPAPPPGKSSATVTVPAGSGKK